MTATRFNVFQRLVRQWDTVHPYNAAQVLRIAGKPDVLALRRAWHATLGALGLGRVQITGRQFRFEAINGNAANFTVPVLPCGTELHEHISTEMNRPFDDDVDLPLRPFILEEAGSFYVGVIYQHWIADSASVRLLLKEWFVRVYDPASASDAPALIPGGGYWAHFGPQRARWRIGEQLLTLLRSASRFRRVRKLRTQGSGDFAMRFALHPIPPEMLAQLLGVARRRMSP